MIIFILRIVKGSIDEAVWMIRTMAEEMNKWVNGISNFKFRKVDLWRHLASAGHSGC